MDGMYRMLGKEREADLERIAETRPRTEPRRADVRRPVSPRSPRARIRGILLRVARAGG